MTVRRVAQQTTLREYFAALERSCGHTITGTYLGTTLNGNMDLIVEPKSVSEPATISILGVALASLELMRRRSRRSGNR